MFESKIEKLRKRSEEARARLEDARARHEAAVAKKLAAYEAENVYLSRSPGHFSPPAMGREILVARIAELECEAAVRKATRSFVLARDAYGVASQDVGALARDLPTLKADLEKIKAEADKAETASLAAARAWHARLSAARVALAAADSTLQLPDVSTWQSMLEAIATMIDGSENPTEEAVVVLRHKLQEHDRAEEERRRIADERERQRQENLKAYQARFTS